MDKKETGITSKKAKTKSATSTKRRSSAATTTAKRAPSKKLEINKKNLKELASFFKDSEGEITLSISSNFSERKRKFIECSGENIPALFESLLKEVAKLATEADENKEITTQQAADILNVSRPYVIKQIDKGVLPCRLVGRDRRIKKSDVLKLRQKMKKNWVATQGETKKQ